jgi:hypothetical protein
VAFDILSGDPLYWMEPAVTIPSMPQGFEHTSSAIAGSNRSLDVDVDSVASAVY